jgi:small subunit ribosomal protein S1
MEGEGGLIQLSKRKADRRSPGSASSTPTEGDVVEGTCMRKIKGGLLVDIGVPVFLPASQVDIRRPHDIGDFIGRNRPRRDPQDRHRAPQHRHLAAAS